MHTLTLCETNIYAIMAILKNGINGGISGKIGNIVGYELFGKFIIRSLPTKSKSKKATALQEKSRNKFKNLQAFLGPLLTMVRIGFHQQGASQQMSAFNAAMSKNLLSAISDEALNPALISLSAGQLPTVINASAEKDDTGIHFSWELESNMEAIFRNDLAMVVAYNAENKIALIDVSATKRNTGQFTLDVPMEKSDLKYHTWLSFSMENRESTSNSIYLGEV